jgi:hypothetical protein
VLHERSLLPANPTSTPTAIGPPATTSRVGLLALRTEEIAAILFRRTRTTIGELGAANLPPIRRAQAQNALAIRASSNGSTGTQTAREVGS